MHRRLSALALLFMAPAATLAQHSHSHDGHARHAVPATEVPAAGMPATGMPATGSPAAAVQAGPAPDGISVQDCWIRSMPAMLPSGGYFVVRNSSNQAVQLTGIATPAYGETMLHQTISQNGTASMVHIDAVQVPAGGELAFKPGSYHAMLEKPVSEIAIGSRIPVVFLLGSAGQLQADCELRPAASTGPR